MIVLEVLLRIWVHCVYKGMAMGLGCGLCSTGVQLVLRCQVCKENIVIVSTVSTRMDGSTILCCSHH